MSCLLVVIVKEEIILQSKISVTIQKSSNLKNTVSGARNIHRIKRQNK